jgi:ubiquinone/menaquinone biosynthesis C-methylase UbiE
MSGSDSYSFTAAFYDIFIEPTLKGVRRVAREVVPPQPGWQVLDVGCGTGTGLEAYADAGCTVTGLDASEAMLARAAARLGDRADLHLAAGDRLPCDGGTFDLVTATMVVHSVPIEDRAGLLSEMARVAKPQGTLLITDFRFGSLRGWRGPFFKGLSEAIERFSGHHAGYRSFKAARGLPGLAESIGFTIRREKIVAGGNIAIYLVTPPTPT